MRLEYSRGPSYISPRQLGASAPAPTVPQIPGGVSMLDSKRFAPAPTAPGMVPTKFGWAAPGGSAGGGGGGAPGGGAPGAPGGAPPGGPPGGPPGAPGGGKYRQAPAAAPYAPPGVPPPDPGAGIVPQTVGGPSWPQQWQSQGAYQQTTVSVPVSVVTQPQLSNYFTPPQPSGDLGPMGSVSEALGIQGKNSQQCLTWGFLGLGLAWLLSRRRKSKHAQAG